MTGCRIGRVKLKTSHGTGDDTKYLILSSAMNIGMSLPIGDQILPKQIAIELTEGNDKGKTND